MYAFAASNPEAHASAWLVYKDISALQNFREVDGGQGKGCRGSHPGDKQEPSHCVWPVWCQESYFKSMIASDLEECKSNCVVDAECQAGLRSSKSKGFIEFLVARASRTRAGVFVKSGSAQEDMPTSLMGGKRTRNPGNCRRDRLDLPRGGSLKGCLQ